MGLREPRLEVTAELMEWQPFSYRREALGHRYSVAPSALFQPIGCDANWDPQHHSAAPSARGPQSMAFASSGLVARIDYWAAGRAPADNIPGRGFW